MPYAEQEGVTMLAGWLAGWLAGEVYGLLQHSVNPLSFA